LVLITEHDENGSVGFVLNKPININIEDVLPDYPFEDFSISLGGPVSTNTLHYIHTLGEKIPNSIKIFDNIYWSGDFDVLKKLIDEDKVKPNELRFFLGYSGWTEKQLEEEISQNSWLVTNVESRKIMVPNMDTIWKEALQALGGKYKMWVNSPENPGMN